MDDLEAKGPQEELNKEKFLALLEEMNLMRLNESKGIRPFVQKSRINEIENIFTKNRNRLLDLFEDSQDEDKLKVAFVLARLFSPFDSGTDETRNFKVKYNRFIDSISDDSILDEDIAYVLKERSFGTSTTPEVLREKIIQAGKKRNLEQFIQIVKLNSDQGLSSNLDIVLEICTAFSRDEREQILNNQIHELPMPQDELVQLRYRLQLMHDFPIEEQKQIIVQVLDLLSTDNSVLGSKEFTKSLNADKELSKCIDVVAKRFATWDKSDSAPLIDRFLNLDSKIFRKVIDNTIFVQSLQNWSIDDAFKFIDSSWDLQENATYLVIDRNTSVNLLTTKFKLAYLAYKQGDFNESAYDIVHRATEIYPLASRDFGRSSADYTNKLIEIFSKNQELIPQYLDLVNSSNNKLFIFMMKKINELPVDDQYQYIDHYKAYYINSKSLNFDLLISNWDVDHQRLLLKQIIKVINVNKIRDFEDDLVNVAITLLSKLPFNSDLIDSEILTLLIDTYVEDYRFFEVFDISERILSLYAKEKPEELKKAVAIKTLVDKKYISLFNDTGVEGFTSLEDLEKYLPDKLKGLMHLADFQSLDNFYQWAHNHSDFISFIISSEDNLCLGAKEYELIKKGLIPFNFLETEVLLRNGIDVSDMKKDESLYKKAWEILKESDVVWKEDPFILGDFEKGAEIFGYRNMFNYVNTEKVSRHDALHDFEYIIALYHASGLKPKTFYGNILFQVSKDNARYNQERSYDQLNLIARNLNRNFEEQLEEMRQLANLENIEELSIFLAKFSTPQSIFESWGNLKLYSDRIRILEQRDFLIKLQQLKNEGKRDLASYIEQLMFHKDSKINADAINEFLLNPEDFLARSDKHTDESIQDRKKPSNYVHIPNLDLTADQLRDALVEGSLDRIQAFVPLKVRYSVPIIDGKYVLGISELVEKALSLDQNSEDSVSLRNQISEVLALEDIDLEDLFSKKRSISANALERIKELFEKSALSKKIEWRDVIVEIHAKSDPKAAIAGDDTINCMPFGAGKSIVYTFNLNTAQLTLQVQNGSDKYRTVAQSVLTKDRDVGREVPDIISDFNGSGKNLSDILPQDVLSSSSSFIACDNIEVAPNWVGDFEPVIEALYAEFFQRYVDLYGGDLSIDSDYVVIGMGYSDAMTYLPKKANTFVPQAPVGYSDKTESQVLVLELSGRSPQAVFVNNVESSRYESSLFGEVPSSDQVSFLTYEDSLAVGYIEGKAYEDNPTLIQNLSNMENALIAMQINNAAKKRPHMSLKYKDNLGYVRGYVLAYEGRVNANLYDDEESQTEDERIVYIADLASDGESQTAGGRLIQSFLELYQKNYLDNGDLISLYMEAREQTSYRILKRQLDKVGKKIGIDFELIELDTYYEGNDTMHPVIIKPKKINA